MEKDILFKIAKLVDNDFIGSEKTFIVRRMNGYYFLSTRICDDCSVVRVYTEYNNGKENILSVTYINGGVDEYVPVQNVTMQKIKELLK